MDRFTPGNKLRHAAGTILYIEKANASLAGRWVCVTSYTHPSQLFSARHPEPVCEPLRKFSVRQLFYFIRFPLFARSDIKQPHSVVNLFAAAMQKMNNVTVLRINYEVPGKRIFVVSEVSVYPRFIKHLSALTAASVKDAATIRNIFKA